MTKTELHRLVDELPKESWEAAAVLLRRAQDPVTARLDAAPYDNEELTGEDLRAVRDARARSRAAVRRDACFCLICNSDGARARSHRELARARGDYVPIMQSVRPSALLLVVRSDSLR